MQYTLFCVPHLAGEQRSNYLCKPESNEYGDDFQNGILLNWSLGDFSYNIWDKEIRQLLIQGTHFRIQMTLLNLSSNSFEAHLKVSSCYPGRYEDSWAFLHKGARECARAGEVSVLNIYAFSCFYMHYLPFYNLLVFFFSL